MLGINGTENPLNDAVTKPRNGESIPLARTLRISGCRSRKITSAPSRADKTTRRVLKTYVGLHQNPGITLFDLICGTKIPEFEAVDVL